MGVLELATGQLRFVNAGHNPPVLLSGGEESFLKRKGGFVLAGMEGIPYKEESLTLKPGDKIFLYTDGVTEAENKNHELYGEDRLADCLKAHRQDAVGDIIEAVKEGLAAHVQGFEQFDDITMLCLEYVGQAR